MTDAVRRVLRYTVPVDDAWHEFWLTGEIVHVDSRSPDVVEFWAVDTTPAEPTVRKFIVVGTGHPWPDHAGRCHGSAITAGGALVWHFLEMVR